MSETEPLRLVRAASASSPAVLARMRKPSYWGLSDEAQFTVKRGGMDGNKPCCFADAIEFLEGGCGVDIGAQEPIVAAILSGCPFFVDDATMQFTLIGAETEPRAKAAESDVKHCQYYEWAIAPTGPNGENIPQKELVVIRWASWLAEAMCRAASGHVPTPQPAPPLHEVLPYLERLNDMIEHIAQYALEDGAHASLQQRAANLCMFVGYIDGMQDRCASWLPRTSYLPPKEAMRLWVI